MKLKFLILFVLLNFSSVLSQNDKTVTLTVSAQGQTISEAKQNALRDAIEQAFGTFISSYTEILNDELVKDEIVSVSNGNIQDYDVISEVELPSGGYATTLKATVSITKLSSFVESNGGKIEFKGSLFAFNVKQQILNEENEVKAIKDLCKVIKNIADTSFDYTITVSDPISLDNNNSKFKIPFYVSVFKNENFNKLSQLLYDNLKSLSLTEQEAADYIKLDKDIYPVSIAISDNEYVHINLRKENSIIELIKMLYYFNHSTQNFKINNGIEEWSNKDYPEKIKDINDFGFRVFLKQENDGMDFGAYCHASIFYSATCKKRGRIILDYNFFNDKIKFQDFLTGFYEPKSKYYFYYPFDFVKNLNLNNGKVVNYSNGLGGRWLNKPKSGLVISFKPNVVDFSESKPKAIEHSWNLRFYCEDIRTLPEIERMSEWVVKPIYQSSTPSLSPQKDFTTPKEEITETKPNNNTELIAFAPSHYVDDPDGWTNFRKAPRGTIIKRLDNKSRCKVLRNENGWMFVELKNGATGYIHSSRLKPIN